MSLRGFIATSHGIVGYWTDDGIIFDDTPEHERLGRIEDGRVYDRHDKLVGFIDLASAGGVCEPELGDRLIE
jgi:hypothetical protein